MTQTAAYIAQLTPMEQKILNIATSHLETSFSLSKSIGFLEWQAQAQQKEQHKQAQQKEQHKQAQQPQESTSAAAPNAIAAEAPRKKIKIFIKKKLNPTLP